MSDPQDKNASQESSDVEGVTAGEEGAATASKVEATIEPEPAAAPAQPAIQPTIQEPAEPPQAPAGPAVAAPSRSGGSGAVAWLALALAALLAAAAGWSVTEMQRREHALDSRLLLLETSVDKEEKVLERVNSLADRWDTRLNDGLGEVREARAGQDSALRTLEEQLKKQLNNQVKALNGKLASQGEALETGLAAQQQALQAQRKQIERFSLTDHRDWLLAEAEYLLRLANQRLIMAGDVVAARALLGSADGIMRELDEVTLHEARAAVAGDLAALKAVPTIDVQGLYLRLGALIQEVDKLVIFRLPDGEGSEVAMPEDWQERLGQGYEMALDKLSQYVTIRRRDVPYEALMDPQWEGLVRQNLRMLLEQAQVALLSGNQRLYKESLQRCNRWVQEFFAADEKAVQSVTRELADLSSETITVDLPDISGSVQALDSAMKQRLQRGSDE